MSDIKIAWGLHKVDGRPRYIMSVRTGLACNCICSACKTPLEAVNSENPDPKRRPHFRHYALPQTVECGFRAVIVAAGAMLERVKSISLPPFSVQAEAVNERGYPVQGHAHTYDGDSAVAFGDLYFDGTVVLLRLNGGRELFLLLSSRALAHVHELSPSAAIMLADVTSNTGLALASPEFGLQLLCDLIAKGRWIRHWDEAALKGKAEEDALRQIESMRQIEALRKQRAEERQEAERKAEIQRQAEASHRNRDAHRQPEAPKHATTPSSPSPQPQPPFEPGTQKWKWCANTRWSREKAVGLYLTAWRGPDWNAVAEEAIRRRDSGADPSEAIYDLAMAYMPERPTIMQNFLLSWGIVAKLL